MGMFDDVVVKMALPVEPAPPQTREFQTKDLECNLDRLTIAEAGRLIRESRLTGDVEDADFHGYLNFHGGDGRGDRGWWEYRAKFTDGVCVEIRCTAFEPGGG